MGRPGKYETHVLPRLDEIADWCRNGATNAEIAERLGIAMSSFCYYQNKHVEFSEVLKKNKRLCRRASGKRAFTIGACRKYHGANFLA